MLYNIEIAQAYSADKVIKQDAFYISMFKSFHEAVKFIHDNDLFKSLQPRIENIIDETIEQQWFNSKAFKAELKLTD